MPFWPINLIRCYLGSGFNKEGKINEAASCSPRLRSESVRESEGPKSQRGGVERTKTDRQRGGLCQLTMRSAV